MEALVEGLSLRDFVLVGHSAGGATPSCTLSAARETVRSLVIVDIDPDAAQPGVGVDVPPLTAPRAMSGPPWRR